jgi:hypothetical protein
MLGNLQDWKKTVDPVVLAEVVRIDQNNPAFEITDWSVDRLSDKGINNPDGLWLIRGLGEDGEGERPWSVVFKILKHQEQELPITNQWYWKRELLVAQSGLIERLPGPVKARCYYRVDETPEGAMMWIEYIQSNRPNLWSLADYAFAGKQLGLWNGACAEQSIDEPWLTRHQYFDWLPDTNPQRDFQFPFNQQYISGNLRDRYERIWAKRKIFYDMLEALPTSFVHFDTNWRNLIIRKGKDGQDELVLLDWAECGLAPLGAELSSIIGFSTLFFERSPSAVSELDASVFTSYVQGLREAGWTGDEAVVRLTFTAWAAIYFCITFPNLTAWSCSPESHPSAMQRVGFAEEELFQNWLPLFCYAVDRAEEALQIINKHKGD